LTGFVFSFFSFFIKECVVILWFSKHQEDNKAHNLRWQSFIAIGVNTLEVDYATAGTIIGS